MSKTTSKSPAHPKTPVSKTPTTPGSKSSSRNGLPPAPQLVTIKYTIDADVIKCPSCMDVFKSPRSLPCGHSVCLECLDSLIQYTESSKNKDTFLCPVCFKNAKPRDTNVIRQKWAQQFPVNSTICRLLRNATMKNPNDNGMHKAFCEICLANHKTRTTVAYCNNCLEYLCDICIKYHEKQEETKDHEMILFATKEDPAERHEATMKEWQRRSRMHQALDEKTIRNENDRRVKIGPAARDGNLVPIGNVIVAQTVTAADSVEQKAVTRLGGFNGKSPNDSATSDFRAVTFLSNTKLVLGDHANKKIKVFDISHKTRVELITDMVLRVDPIHMCRVDENTVAVVTERSGNFHIRLFTIRDKIMHFVHRTVDGVPLGVGFLNNTVVCSFLDDVALHKYRLTRAQQLKLGTYKHDKSGNDIFRHPGAICSGIWRGIPVLYVADETEFGVTVCAIDARGDKKASVFFEITLPKTKPSKRSASGVAKTGRQNKANKTRGTKPDETLEGTIGRNGTFTSQKSPKQTVRKSTSQSKEKIQQERVSGRHTFRRVDDFGRVMAERKVGREIERTPVPGLKTELTIDLTRLTTEEPDLNETIGTIAKTTTRKSTRSDMKAVERARRPIGKVLPQQTNEINTRSEKSSVSENASTMNPNSTITSNSTFGTVTFQIPPKLVYRADSIDVDNQGNIYVCMSSMNKIHQMSSDGRMKRDLLTEKDGLLAPKVICFSPKNDVFVVTNLKNNRVLMYRLKH